MKIRRIIATITIAALFFWVPSIVPVKAVSSGCGTVKLEWKTADTAFAFIAPCPVGTSNPTPWVVIAIGASAVSVIVNSIIVSNTQCRELTQAEAVSSILLPFLGMAFNHNNNRCRHHR